MAVHSRAFLLLRRDLVILQRFPLTGISAAPTNSLDLFHWTAKIEGLSGTIWEGGVFQVTLSFTEDFNTRPPQINFMTIPFHPNVDPTHGSPSLGLLTEEGWSGDDCTMSSLLLALQVLLSNPELDSACVRNSSAAHLIKEAPHTYKQMVLDCVTASLRIDAGLTPYEPESPPHSPKSVSVPSPPVGRQQRPTKPISYDDYHVLWKGIATSVTEYRQSNEFARLLVKDAKLGSVHGRPDQGIEAKIEQHAEIKYGRPPKSKRNTQSVSSVRSRLKRVEELKSMYRQATEGEHDTKDSLAADMLSSKDTPFNMDSTLAEHSGDDVDQLVQWTKELDEQQFV